MPGLVNFYKIIQYNWFQYNYANKFHGYNHIVAVHCTCYINYKKLIVKFCTCTPELLIKSKLLSVHLGWISRLCAYRFSCTVVCIILYNYEFLGPIGSDGLVGMFFIFKSCLYFKWVILSFKLKVILSEHTWIILGIPGKKGPPGKFGW